MVFRRLLFLSLMLTSLSALADHQLLPKYFGHTKYDGAKRQVGLLLNPIEGESESYYAVVMEYLNPFKEKNFVADFVRPGKKKLFSKKKNGYLQELLQWIKIYKIVRSEEMTYKLYNVSVKNGEVVADKIPTEGELKINGRDAYLSFVVAERKFDVVLDSQRRFPLKSTWDLRYTPGPYNPGYKQAGITILDLVRDMDPVTKTGTAMFDVEKLKGKEVVIKGELTAVEPQPGMVTFKNDRTQPTIGANLVTDKIGAFIDVYDAKPVMTTVELVLIDPANPFGSQMYFEEYGNEDK